MNKLIALVVMGFTASLIAGDLTGTVTLKGTPPAEKELTPLKEDATCGKLVKDTPKTTHYVVGVKGELANCVVIVKGVPGAKSTGASAAAVVIDQKTCVYHPHIFAVQTGQKITAKNSDPVMHNVHTTPTSGMAEFNQAQMAGAPDLTISFDKPEAFLKFKCDVHPWMFAYVGVLPHPYFAVTDKDGNYKISGVPAGKYSLVAFHRKAHGTEDKAAVKEITVADAAVSENFTVEVAAQ